MRAGDGNRDHRLARGEVRAAYVEDVLSLVEKIPAGRAMSYGQIADIVGRGGPRGVGRVMAIEGAAVPWWRVVRADGSLPPSHQRDALAHYREEGTPMRGNLADAASLRIDLASARWMPRDESDSPVDAHPDLGRSVVPD